MILKNYVELKSRSISAKKVCFRPVNWYLHPEPPAAKLRGVCRTPQQPRVKPCNQSSIKILQTFANQSTATYTLPFILTNRTCFFFFTVQKDVCGALVWYTMYAGNDVYHSNRRVIHLGPCVLGSPCDLSQGVSCSAWQPPTYASIPHGLNTNGAGSELAGECRWERALARYRPCRSATWAGEVSIS